MNNNFKERKHEETQNIELAKGVVPTSANHYIVGIGASAGGLEAINEFFDNIPSDTGFSFVVIQHLSPNYKSLLRDLISKHTEMEVVEANDNMYIKPNKVYVIPIKKFIVVEKGRLKLLDKIISQEPNKAIDIFIKSLAKDRKEKAIAIILSGTGSDGTEGIEAVKENGGLVLVQDPESAKFDGMPNSAIESRNFDSITTPELMFHEIMEFLRQPSAFLESSSVSDNDRKLLQEIFNMIRKKDGLDFSNYKKTTLVRRINRRMLLKKSRSLPEYVDLLTKHPDELSELSKDFLIGVTRFFRDQEAFDLLKQNVIPELIQKKIESGEALKIWSAGTCTGEEAYSVAILVQEYLNSINQSIEVKIFASDIDKNSLEIASKGVYTEEMIREIPAHIVKRYFIKEENNYQVISSIRRMIIFTSHNVTIDPPFSKIDLVLCRNLLIYLNPFLQRKVLSSIHFSLNVGGYLLLGPSENLGDFAHSFLEVDKKWKLYNNLKQAKYPFPINQLNYGNGNALNYTSNADNNLHKSSSNLLHVLNEAAYENFGYAGIFVDENYNIIEAYGKYKDFISLPDNRLTYNFLKLVPKEISIVLGSALLKAFKNNEKASIKNIRVKEDNTSTRIGLTVIPFLNLDKYPKKSVLVLLSKSDVEKPIDVNLNDSRSSFEDALKRIAELENELTETRHHLQTAIEEVETANEELQSSNEELISSNEELQSTNEELQSLNEELHTVNAEHQLKIKELAELNDDLRNYFNSTEIGQIFLSKSLHIQKFTPAASSIINLIETDIGRPISDISHNILYSQLIDDIKSVIKTSKKIVKEVQLANSNWYQMSITPYIRAEKIMDGVVITFVNISQIKRITDQIAGVLNSSLSGIMAFKPVRNNSGNIVDLKWTLANKAAGELVGIKDDRLIGKQLLKLLPGLKKDGLFDKFTRVIKAGVPLRAVHFYSNEDSEKWLEVSAVKIEDGITVTLSDITAKKNAEQKLLSAYEHLQQKESELLKLNNELEQKVGERTKQLHEAMERIKKERENFYNVFMQAPALVCTFKGPDHVFELVNQQYQKVFEGRDLVGEKIKDALPEMEPGFFEMLDQVYKTGEPYIGREVKIAQVHNEKIHDGERYFNFIYQPYFSNANEIEGILVLGYEVTEHVKARKIILDNNKQLRKINNELDSFIYVASHDLKAPINNIEGLVNELEETLKEENIKSPQIPSMINMILTSVKKFNDTIGNLTDIIKIQKQTDEEIENIDCREIIEDVKIGLRTVINQSNAKIITEIADDITIFRFSRRNMQSILTNLLSNSIKYRSPGRTPEIKISTRKSPGYNIIEVSDNGLGIPRQKLPQVFEMFKRFHTHVDGAGIGLNIVKRIVDNAGGKIEVESEVGKGTTFRVYIRE